MYVQYILRVLVVLWCGMKLCNQTQHIPGQPEKTKTRHFLVLVQVFLIYPHVTRTRIYPLEWKYQKTRRSDYSLPAGKPSGDHRGMHKLNHVQIPALYISCKKKPLLKLCNVENMHYLGILWHIWLITVISICTYLQGKWSLAQMVDVLCFILQVYFDAFVLKYL